MKSLIYILPAILFLTSCAQVPLTPEQLDVQQGVVCFSKQQCETYWARANIWIGKNSLFRIQISNNSLIQTFGPVGTDVRIFYSVYKEPTTGEGAHITYTADCSNPFGCVNRPIDSLVALKRYILTGQ